MPQGTRTEFTSANFIDLPEAQGITIRIDRRGGAFGEYLRQAACAVRPNARRFISKLTTASEKLSEAGVFAGYFIPENQLEEAEIKLTQITKDSLLSRRFCTGFQRMPLGMGLLDLRDQVIYFSGFQKVSTRAEL